jgi:hypothetical protein
MNMTTWGEFAAAHPSLAAFGADCLGRRPAYLATLMKDGNPKSPSGDARNRH